MKLNLSNVFLIGAGGLILWNQFVKAKQSTWFFERIEAVKFNPTTFNLTGTIVLKVENKTDLSVQFKGIDLNVFYRSTLIDNLKTSEVVNIPANSTKFLNIPFSIGGSSVAGMITAASDFLKGNLQPFLFKGNIYTNIVNVPINYNYSLV